MPRNKYNLPAFIAAGVSSCMTNTYDVSSINSKNMNRLNKFFVSKTPSTEPSVKSMNV